MSSLSNQCAVETITARHNHSYGKTEGMSVGRELKRNLETQFVPILLLTGWESGQNHLTEITGSADAWLKEPLEKLELITGVRALIEKRGFADNPDKSLQEIEVKNEDDGALIEKIEKRVEARLLEQPRSRLLALTTELESGRIVHRRTLRVNQLSHLRDQAVKELRSLAGLEGPPQTLPGPEADEWIEWACSLKDAENAECVQTLRNGFAHLDDFVANLEPKMWVAARSSALGNAAGSGEICR